MAEFGTMGPSPDELFGPADYTSLGPTTDELEAIEAASALAGDGLSVEDFDMVSGADDSYASRQIAETLEMRDKGIQPVRVSISLANVIDREDWMPLAKCKDVSPSIFFPSDGVGVQEAQRICRECPVVEECLDFALAERIDHGVWGGKSERERRRVIRRRRIQR